MPLFNRKQRPITTGDNNSTLPSAPRPPTPPHIGKSWHSQRSDSNVSLEPVPLSAPGVDSYRKPATVRMSKYGPEVIPNDLMDYHRHKKSSSHSRPSSIGRRISSGSYFNRQVAPPASHKPAKGTASAIYYGVDNPPHANAGDDYHTDKGTNSFRPKRAHSQRASTATQSSAPTFGRRMSSYLTRSRPHSERIDPTHSTYGSPYAAGQATTPTPTTVPQHAASATRRPSLGGTRLSDYLHLPWSRQPQGHVSEIPANLTPAALSAHDHLASHSHDRRSGLQHTLNAVNPSHGSAYSGVPPRPSALKSYWSNESQYSPTGSTSVLDVAGSTLNSSYVPSHQRADYRHTPLVSNASQPSHSPQPSVHSFYSARSGPAYPHSASGLRVYDDGTSTRSHSIYATPGPSPASFV